MHEPSLRTSRLAISGGLLAAIVMAGAGFFLGRTTSPDAEPRQEVQQPVPVIVPPPPAVEAPRILGRGDIIALGNRAADALTSGAQLPEDVMGVAGRRFEILLPFGCDGPAPEGSTAPMRWRYDADERTLRIHVAPTRWQAADWGMRPADGADANYKGFWISRPWSSAQQCPKTQGQGALSDVQPVTLPGETLALAQIPQNEEGRSAERPYETVQRVPPDKLAAAQGFRLRVVGRIERLPGGSPVKCIQPAGIQQRPICLVAASFDEIRIENPVNDETLATWSMRPALRNSP